MGELRPLHHQLQQPPPRARVHVVVYCQWQDMKKSGASVARQKRVTIDGN